MADGDTDRGAGSRAYVFLLQAEPHTANRLAPSSTAHCAPDHIISEARMTSRRKIARFHISSLFCTPVGLSFLSRKQPAFPYGFLNVKTHLH